MKNIKKIITGLLIITTLAASITACGKSETSKATSSSTIVKLGVVGSVYEELWTPAKALLAGEGIDLQIVQFSDYTTPNNALNSGEIDLNAFQHQIYLETEVKNYGYEVEPIGYTFIIPLNVYSKKVTSISKLKDGDTIAIPNDVTNGGRALKVLAAAGLIKIKSTAAFNPTVEDIETYNVKITIKGLAANTIPSILEDVTAAVVNGNFALDFGLKTSEAIFKDTSIDQQKYWNLIAAKSSNLKDQSKVEVYKKVVEAFQTEDTKKVFNDKYGGYFISEGWDQDLLK
ncbi:MetQ/NlpA family ABC transporter substrate-binding protein [[Clostridium] fimetarium]|uniref:D-methionine transport system substrate-binding protein n=1 Tax=[Clostridium] fimetarium TaxID=99656 RepID=A0A1I0QYZ2_9FIRM|nr:MetQ/NlpA family ABC transporter substrate-binding protein [[Clostridium] fimetarium]SEW32655.1 D-methionine transport system substrate-binding protein [[Clostridium] fimetarium]